MALGPGKYDALCTHVRNEAKARGAIVIVWGGEHGSGFSVQIAPEDTIEIPRALRRIAKEIEHDILGGSH